MEYQRRYVNFARVHGMTPEDMEAWIRKTWNGSSNFPFMQWIGEQIRAFRKIRPDAFQNHGLVDHAAFDAFLDSLPVTGFQPA